MLLCYSWGDVQLPDNSSEARVDGGTSNPTPAVHRRWVPSSPDEVELCGMFLDYVMQCSPTTQRILMDVHLGFLGVLAQRWIPAGTFLSRLLPS